MADKQDTNPVCTTCKKGPPEVTLKNCAKCSTTTYCFHPCQRADWKVHKKVCGKNQASSSGRIGSDHGPVQNLLSPPKGLDDPITKPFTRLDNGTWLHDRPEEDVYRVLIDAYRFRLEDDYTFDEDCAMDSIYGGVPDSLIGFRKFLRKATSRPGLLPSWWNKDKQKECEKFGMEQHKENFHDLRCCVEKSDLIEHYGDPRFPMQLRMLAEAVLKRGPAGQDGTPMRQSMVAMKSGP